MESVPEVRDYPQRSQPTGAGGRLRALLNGRGIWALADQAMLSLGNFFTNILLGRNLPRDEFGNFVVLLSVIQFLNNLHWSLVTYPLSVISAGDDENALRHRAIRSLRLTLL